jgi:hypothetical protein
VHPWFLVHCGAPYLLHTIYKGLSGEAAKSILTRHYLVPQSTLKVDVLQALEKLQSQLLLF